MASIQLYHEKRDDIEIDIRARLDRDDLVIEGRDVGHLVRQLKESIDYEYNCTVKAEEIEKLAELLSTDPNDPQSLLKALKTRFNGNNCFSEMCAFFKENGIGYTSFFWP